MLTRINHYFLSTLAITFGLSGTVFAMDIAPALKKSETHKTLSTHTLDWVQTINMTAQQQKRYSNTSCGAFIEPRYNNEDTDVDMQDAPLRVTADSTKALSLIHISEPTRPY